MGSLAMTYFLTRKCNIIGAVSFHGPVREGKGWVRNAMVAKRNWLLRRILGVRRSRDGEKVVVVTAWSCCSVARL